MLRQLRRAAARAGVSLLRRWASSTAASSAASGSAATVNVTVNGARLALRREATVLDACAAANVEVPTLCYHPRLPHSGGTCRVCLVSVAEGDRAARLRPACVTKLAEGMAVETETPAVHASRTSTLSLLRAAHPDACLTCLKSGHCEFQDLMVRYNVPTPPAQLRTHRPGKVDKSATIVRDPEKCLLCYRCVQACSDLQGMDILGLAERGAHELVGPRAAAPMSATECISCGQCAYFCPTGALMPRQDAFAVMDAINERDSVMVAQIAPSVRVAIGEEFGFAPGEVTTGKLVATLRRLGFAHVFDANFSADLTIMEEANELIERVHKGGPFPMFTSCCPGWVNLVEKVYPEFIPNLSTCKSPQQMLGGVIKRVFAHNAGIPIDKIKVVSIMPCTAKKEEAQRPQHDIIVSRDPPLRVPEVDYVLTTREIARIIELRRVPFASLPEEPFDDPLGESTGAAAIFGVTGGVLEAALRTAYETIMKQPLPKLEFEQVRGFDAVRLADIELGGLKLRVGVTHGTHNIRTVMDRIRRGELKVDFMEFMACRGGCIGGGGQPYSADPKILEKRAKGVYSIDERAAVRKSHENKSVQRLYAEHLEHPGSHEAHAALHCTYSDRSAGAHGVDAETDDVDPLAAPEKR